MDINKKKEEVKAEYKQKLQNLRQTEELANKLRTECINLEGQLYILNQLNKKDDNSN